MAVIYICSKCGEQTDNYSNKNLCRKCEMIMETKPSDTKLNSINNETNCSIPDGSATTDLYFGVWCKQLGFTQANPWRIQQVVAQDMQTAAKMFIEWFNERNKDCGLAFNPSKNDAIVFVQDWRGRIAKFEIIIKTKQIYTARRIK